MQVPLLIDEFLHRPARLYPGKTAVVDGDLRLDYAGLQARVNQLSHALLALGVTKGDRVTIYVPRIPELVMAMLACAKIGAVHSVVYGGFSVEALGERIEDSESWVRITADGRFLRRKIVHLKAFADEALQRCGTVEHVVVIRRTGETVHMEQDRDYYYDELMALPIARTDGPKCETELEVFEFVYDGMQKGAVGVNLGRNVWQNEQPVAVARALRAIIHEGANAKEAHELFQEIRAGGEK